MDPKGIPDQVCDSFAITATLIHTKFGCRTMSVLHLLDCAFLFFQNHPVRLTFAELDVDLPSHNALFDSPNPFVEPTFHFSRGLTIRMLLDEMFQIRQTPIDSVSGRWMPTAACGQTLSLFDMFILIHSKSQAFES